MLTTSSELEIGSSYDVIGRVDHSMEISEMQTNCLGYLQSSYISPAMDLSAYDKMVVIAQSFPDIFGW